ncbi:MAG: ribokinase [Eubacteriales bacterium]
MDKIVVFGSFAADLTSRAPRLPKSGETIIGSSFKIGPGGKGSNQGVAAKRAGADMTMITKVGNDVFGKIALDIYKNEGMSTEHIFIDQEKETGTALIMVDENTAENQILVVSGACGNISDQDIKSVEHIIEDAKIVLMQLEINMDATEKVIKLAHGMSKTIVLNTAPAMPLSAEILSMVSIVTPNEHEAEIMTGIKVSDRESAEIAADRLMEMGVGSVVITMGKEGAFVKSDGESRMIDGISVNAVDTTGAGDAFNGAFVTALSEGMDIFEAARFGNAAGALSVTKYGTAPAMPYREEIEKALEKKE